jgi:hypothetical protein
MPKPILNNKIIYPNLYGRIYQFENWLNQGVSTGDSPYFVDLFLSGNATIDGNLYVKGNTTILDTNVIEFEDNIILLNRLETGSGVTLNQSGFEIERGSLENYRVVFDESTQTFRIGVISNMQAVATREDNPLINGIMTWNNSTKRLDSTNIISIDLSLSSTTNSSSSTTGSLKLSGGLGIKKDITSEGKLYLVGSNYSNISSIWTDSSNILNITSPTDINLTPQTKIKIPFDKALVFGNNTQSISSNLATNNLNINSNGNIEFYLPFGKSINIPNLVPITFSTQSEKIFTNGLNDMVITGSENIQLTPGSGKSIIIPVDIPIIFYNNTQSIKSNLLNDLNINAGNNIYLTPGLNQNIQIPFDNGLKFGNSGNQKIISTNDNVLTINASSDIILSSNSHVKIPVNVPLAFGNNYLQSLTADTFGNLSLSANSKFKVYPNTEFLNTTESTNYANGSVVNYGGLGIYKNLNVGGNATIYGNLTVQGTTTTVNSETVSIKDNLFLINNVPVSMADGGILIKRFSDGISNTTGNIYSSIFYKESTDEITFAYTQTDPGASTINISDYLPLRAESIKLQSTEDAINSSYGSIITQGGASINKALVVGTGITTGAINVSGISYIANITSGNNNIGNITTSNINITNSISIDSTLDVINSTTASCVIYGGLSLIKSLWVGSNVKFFDTTPSTSSSSSSLIMSGGISINTTQDAENISSGGGITIAGGASIAKNTYIGGNLNSNSITVNSTKNSINVTSGSIITNGGISINCTTNSLSYTNGGALTISGGASINKDVYIGGKLNCIDTANFINDVNILGNVTYNGGGGIYSINNTSGNSQWYYLGQLSNYLDMEISNSIDQQQFDQTYLLKVVVSINNTNVSMSQNHYGSLSYNSELKSTVYIYQSLDDQFHLFLKTPEYSLSNIRVISNTNSDGIIINYEGSNILPDGTFSGFSGWNEIDNSNNESNINISVGDIISEGSQFLISDNIPIIGHNNSKTINNRNLGILFQRYQLDNDSSQGGVINDTVSFTDTLPDQSSANSNQIKLSNIANSTDNYYNGWWIKINSGLNSGQVRQIITYNGAQRVAQLSSNWTNQNPSSGDNVNLYSHSYYSLLFDEIEKTAKLAFVSDATDTSINIIEYLSLDTKSLNLRGTAPSTSVTTGNLISLGGISINNTTDAVSCSNRGTITTLGGVGINKKLYVGENIILSENEISPETSLHISKQNATIKLESSPGNYSYIDFNSNFGIISNDIFSITYNSMNDTPNNSYSAITINSSGNIGIQTTDSINSALTILKNNFISISDNTGYLGILAANENSSTSGTSIMLYGENTSINSGSIILNTFTNGNFIVESNNNVNFKINEFGQTYIYSTTNSFNSSSGALCISGGVSINSTENAISYTQGGALTLSGGASISQDLYLAGDLYINGDILASTNISPNIIFSDYLNCTLNTFGNSHLSKIGSDIITFSFFVSVYPTIESTNCQFEFELPEKINNFLKRTDLIASCSGYTDDDEIIPLFNTICVAQKNSKNGIIKFQSVSLNLHYFTIICKYNI